MIQEFLIIFIIIILLLMLLLNAKLYMKNQVIALKLQL
jgi:hypothetical protein